jgi:hypothetical protein
VGSFGVARAERENGLLYGSDALRPTNFCNFLGIGISSEIEDVFVVHIISHTVERDIEIYAGLEMDICCVIGGQVNTRSVSSKSSILTKLLFFRNVNLLFNL